MNRNPSFNQKGEKHPAWRGGKPFCGCGKQLASYSATRCKSCNNRHRWSNEQYKQSVSEQIGRSRVAMGVAVKEKNPRWKGGVTPLKMLIRKCSRYKKWASEIKQRDNWTCQMCQKRGGWVETDHFPKTFAEIMSSNQISTFSQAMMCSDFWNLNNGRVLCRGCHKLTFMKI